MGSFLIVWHKPLFYTEGLVLLSHLQGGFVLSPSATDCGFAFFFDFLPSSPQSFAPCFALP